MSEIVVGDSFGVDRMDYLLRDSLHVGVQYGRFDHYRLIETLRILPKSDDSEEPTLGLEHGGFQSAEALLLARYSMFTQVYLHPVRRAYDLHLKDFLRELLPGGVFPTAPHEFLKFTDVEVLAAIYEQTGNGSEYAKRIANRQHFKVAYSRNPDDLRVHAEPGRAVSQALAKEFSKGNVKLDSLVPRGYEPNFPVLQPDGRIVSSLVMSDMLQHIPVAAIDFVFVEPLIRDDARKFIHENRGEILAESGEGEVN